MTLPIEARPVIADCTLLIRNAPVSDSTGAAPRHEDLAIANGCIAARGPMLASV